MAATFKWLLKSTPLESHLVPTATGGSHNFTLFGGLNIDEETESLDTFLNHMMLRLISVRHSVLAASTEAGRRYTSCYTCESSLSCIHGPKA